MSVLLIEAKMTCLHPLRCKSDKGEKSEGKRKEKKDCKSLSGGKGKGERRAKGPLDQSATKCAEC